MEQWRLSDCFSGPHVPGWYLRLPPARHQLDNKRRSRISAASSPAWRVNTPASIRLVLAACTRRLPSGGLLLSPTGGLDVVACGRQGLPCRFAFHRDVVDAISASWAGLAGRPPAARCRERHDLPGQSRQLPQPSRPAPARRHAAAGGGRLQRSAPDQRPAWQRRCAYRHHRAAVRISRDLQGRQLLQHRAARQQLLCRSLAPDAGWRRHGRPLRRRLAQRHPPHHGLRSHDRQLRRRSAG